MMMWLLLILLVVVLALWYGGMLSAFGGAADMFKKDDLVTWEDDMKRSRSGKILGPSGVNDMYPVWDDKAGQEIKVSEQTLANALRVQKYPNGSEIVYCNSGVVESFSDGKYKIKLNEPANTTITSGLREIDHGNVA
jgi:hypothetical protein